MHLQKILIKDFRNFKNTTLIPSKNFNYFFGMNGAGKTNLLEAVYFLINLQSFKKVQRNELINHDSDGMYLRGEFGDVGGSRSVLLEAAVNDRERKYKIDGEVEQDLFSYLGQTHAVIFFPDSLRFVKEGPLLRRMVFDRAIAAETGSHLFEARKYRQLLRERNRLLKQHGDAGIIASWASRLLEVAARIIVRRYLYLKSLRQLIPALCSNLGVSSLLEVVYCLGTGSQSQRWDNLLGKAVQDQEGAVLEAEISKILACTANKVLAQERELGKTLWGPHLDDFEIFWNGRKAKDSASQGEQRLLTIILAACSAESYKKKKNDRPIVLLDDLSSELDLGRRTAILEYLETTNEQVFITSTEKPRKEKHPKGARYFCVKNGNVSSQ